MLQPQPVIQAAVRPQQPVPAPVVVKAKPKVAAWVWVTLIVAPVLLIVVVAGIIIVSTSKPTVPATWTYKDNYPFNLYYKITAPKNQPVLNDQTALNDQLDKLYNQGRTALTNRQFQDAQVAFEKLRDQQYQASQFSDFQQILVNLRKAVQIANTLPAADRNMQEESWLQSRLDVGTLYEQAVTAYNQQKLDAAAPVFQQLYARDQNFRNTSGLYYDTLVKLGDTSNTANQPEQAYLFYARAAALKKVADVRYAQTRASLIENQLRQAGKPVPTVPAS